MQQTRTVSFWPSLKAKFWTRVVFPVPVSPTKSTSSLCLTDLAIRSNASKELWIATNGIVRSCNCIKNESKVKKTLDLYGEVIYHLVKWLYLPVPFCMGGKFDLFLNLWQNRAFQIFPITFIIDNRLSNEAGNSANTSTSWDTIQATHEVTLKYT
jgi:hypothetical protein